MEAERNRRSSREWCYSVTAGLEAGVLGGLLLLVWLFLVADWRRQTPWSVLNLFGGAFYPDLVFRVDFSSATLPGLAIALFSSGCVGAIFGATVAPMASTRRRALFGLLIALCWYYLSFSLIWKRHNPALFYYGGRDVFLIAYLLFGVILGLQPYLAESLASFADVSSAKPVVLLSGPQDPDDESRIQ